MTRIPTVLAALLVASGVAFAADSATTSGSKTSSAYDNSTTTSQSNTGDSLGDKTKRGLHKVGSAVKRAGHKMADAARHIAHPHGNQQASSSSDTRSMGAPGNDSARQGRMDSAYANWQKKQDRSR